MKNKLIDLNNHLFAQLELLGDESLKGDRLGEEIERSKAMGGIADKIINNASLSLKAHTLINEGHIRTAPKMIGIEVDDEV